MSRAAHRRSGAGFARRGGGRGFGSRRPPPQALGVFSAANWFTKAAFSLTGAFSVELLVYITDWNAAATQILCAVYTGSQGYALLLNANGVQPVAYTSGGPEFALAFKLDDAVFPTDDVDNHLALLTLTCDGTTLRGHMNGAEVGVGTALAGTITPASADLAIGAWLDGSLPLIGGKVLYCATTNVALTPVQVRDRAAQIMARSFPALPGTASVWVEGNTALTPLLTQHGTVPRAALVGAPYIKYSGRITISGDSTDLGSVALQGSYATGMLDLFIAAGNRAIFVGSENIFAARGIYGFVYAGAAIDDFKNAGAHPLAAEVAAKRSRFTVIGAVYNDLRSNIGITSAAIAAKVITVGTEVLAAYPATTLILKYILTTDSGAGSGAWPQADYPAYVVGTADWNTVGRAIVVAHFAALGVTVLLAGANGLPMVYSDRVHPIGPGAGSGGYENMVDGPYTCIIRAKAA